MALVAGAVFARSTSSSLAEPAAVDIVAAGDIACDPAYPDFNAGSGTAVGCHEKATSDLVAKINPKAVLALGDIQYVHGSLANYAASYDPTWGRFKAITRRCWATTRAEKAGPTRPTSSTSDRTPVSGPRATTVMTSGPGI